MARGRPARCGPTDALQNAEPMFDRIDQPLSRFAILIVIATTAGFVTACGAAANDRADALGDASVSSSAAIERSTLPSTVVVGVDHAPTIANTTIGDFLGAQRPTENVLGLGSPCNPAAADPCGNVCQICDETSAGTGKYQCMLLCKPYTGHPNFTCDASSGTCYDPLPIGASCAGAAATHCASGEFCTDGRCCGVASCGAGKTCGGPSGAGTCTTIAGGSCSSGTTCSTGNCVDGACCNVSTCPQCGSCNVAGSAGNCAPIAGAPINGRPACSTGSDVCSTQTCTGAADLLCHYSPTSTVCGADTCRDSSTQEYAGHCDGSGSCTQPADKSCSPFQCSSAACGTDCRVSGCVSPFVCNASTGACVSGGGPGSPCSAGPCGASAPTCVDGVCCKTSSCATGYSCNGSVNTGTCSKKQGTACSSDTECGTGACTDGVCCDQACTGKCQACDNAGSVGTCTPTSGAPHNAAKRGTCATGSDASCNAVCNGADILTCHFPGAAKTCGTASCNASTGIETHVSYCDGGGNCSDVSKSCSPFVCSGTTCKSTCSADGDCATGYFCQGGACAPAAGVGGSCTTPASCGAGLFCTDGHCCGVSTCGAGKTCGGPSAPGSCTTTQGGSCAVDANCATGHCVDGVCCDTACAGQCQACNVATKIGACSPVVGAPHGTRLSCPSSSGDVACSSVCNGIDTATCHFPSGSTSCGAASCSSGVEKHVSACDGAGNCGDVPKSCSAYACGPTSCKTTCAVDGDCISGYFCDVTSHACTKTAGIGNPCSGASACGAGTYCTDGYCCGVTSCGAGKTCGGSHPGTCTTLNGGTCKIDVDCANGHCVDGVCCDSACSGQCQACDVGGKVGTCSPVLGGPHGARIRCPASSGDPSCASVCNGLDVTTCHYPGGSTSCGAASCSAGLEKHVSACDGAGNCGDTPKACDKYVCGPTACKTSCTADGDCIAGYFCNAGACSPTSGLGKSCSGASACASGLFCTDGVCCGVTSCGAGKSCAINPGTCSTNLGGACAVDGDCGSGHCVDRVCCDSACSGQCQACDVVGKIGTCSPTAGIPHGTRAKCSSAGTDPICGATCDGSDPAKCNFPTASTACGAATCKDGKETHVSSCDGAGSCADVAKACTPYACSATACSAGCSADTDCATGSYCKGGLCVPYERAGAPCTSPTACGAGLHCTDGFCCGDATCGPGGTCAFPGKEGTCVQTNGGACSLGTDCGSGSCTDGVCCDTKCDGQCEACDVPDLKTGRAGKCIPIAGKPHGKRVSCADGGGDVCAAASCDGSDTTKCAAFTTGEICRPQSCADGVLTAPASCDGKGKCPTLITSKCDGFVCTPDGKACETSCVDDSKCIADYLCKDGKCRPKTATCSDDGLASKSPDGTVLGCAPFRCSTDGTCSKTCATSDECAPGYACDSAQKCVAASGGTSSSGGCSTGRDGGDGAVVFGSTLALLGLIARRRRLRASEGAEPRITRPEPPPASSPAWPRSA